MDKLKPVSISANYSREEKQLLENFNLDIKRLNVLIDKYNALPKVKDYNSAERRDVLGLLHQEYQEVYNKYCEEALPIVPKLMDVLQDGNKVLDEKAKKYKMHVGPLSASTASAKQNPLAQLINTTPSSSLQEFTERLWNKAGLSGMKLDAALKDFLQNNEITFLGGINSRNFLVKPETGAPYVLRLEDRMGQPKYVEKHLRSNWGLNSPFVGVMADKNLGERNVMVTDFCAGSDLRKYGEDRSSDEARVESGLRLFNKMLDIISHAQEEGCLFPDMKNENWLVDNQGALRISDTKSLLRLDEGVVPKHQGLLSTASIIPPETAQMVRGEAVSADKLHAYIFGKNLYEYLTSCKSGEMVGKKDASELNFNKPVFQTEKGKALKALISNTVKIDPSQRLSIKEAKAELEQILSPKMVAQRDTVESRKLAEPFNLEGKTLLRQQARFKENVAEVREGAASKKQDEQQQSTKGTHYEHVKKGI